MIWAIACPRHGIMRFFRGFEPPLGWHRFCFRLLDGWTTRSLYAAPELR